MTRNYSSNAIATTLSAGINDSTTTVPVTATTGFPAADFIIAVDYGAAEQELMLVTAVAGLNLTVTRGYDSTTAQAHSLAAVVRHVHAAIDFRDSRTHEAASTGVHGVAGAVVGTTDTQALTNKDLSSGTNTLPTGTSTASNTQTLTNKTVALGSNTISGTKAQFNTALTDGDFATLAGTETLTGKTVDLTDNTVTGTIAEFNTAVSDADLATLAGTETLTNKTLTAPTLTSPVIDTLAGVTGVGQFRYVPKGSDEPVTSSTYQDDDALTFSVVANAVYEIDYHFILVTQDTAGGKVQVTMPASATWRTSPIASSSSPAPITSGNTGGGGQQNKTLASSNPVILTTGATAGSVTVQFAQDVTDATPTTMKANSYISVRRVV